MMRVRPVLVVSAIVCSLLGTPAALATVDNFGRVTVSPNFSGGSGPYDHFVTQPGVIDLSGSATGGFSSSGSGTSHTEYGLVRLSGDAVGSLGTACSGYFRDTITINAPGVAPGTSGTLTFRIRTSGSMSASSGSSATLWSVAADVGGGQYDMGHTGRVNSPELPPVGYSGDPLGVYSATAPITFGMAMPMDVEFSVTAGASNSFNSSGAASFSDMVLTWEGISNVTVNGSPVGSFTVNSQTGIDWVGPHVVPTCITADFNCDGDFGTDADIEAFFACLAGACPPFPCTSTSDFNGDGDFGTDADIESFFRVLAGGAC